MKWMRDRRDSLGITQEDLAARLQLRGYDVGRGSISHWESGRYRPPMDDTLFVEALADALQLDVPTVLRMSGYAVIANHSDLAERLAAIADRLPEQRRRQLLRIAETFLEE